MAVSIASLLPNAGAGVYYESNWHLMMETHLPVLLARNDVSVIAIEPALAWKYEGDLFGLLTELKYPPKLHWLIMRLNLLRSSFDYRHETLQLIVPTSMAVEELTSRYRTTMRKIK